MVTSKLMLQVVVGTVELSLSLHVSPLDEHYTAEASCIFPYFVISFYQFQFLQLVCFLMISIKELLELFFLFNCIRNFENVFLFFYYSVQYIQIVNAIGWDLQLIRTSNVELIAFTFAWKSFFFQIAHCVLLRNSFNFHGTINVICNCPRYSVLAESLDHNFVWFQHLCKGISDMVMVDVSQWNFYSLAMTWYGDFCWVR